MSQPRPPHEPCLGRQSGKELVRYRDRGQAHSAASQLRARYGKVLQPYACARCRYWHLGSAGG